MVRDQGKGNLGQNGDSVHVVVLNLNLNPKEGNPAITNPPAGLGA